MTSIAIAVVAGAGVALVVLVPVVRAWLRAQYELNVALRHLVFERERLEKRVEKAENWARSTREKNRRLRRANRDLRSKARAWADPLYNHLPKDDA